MSYAVVVRLKIAPGRMDDFLPLMRDNAQASLSTEPDCLQFDVLTDPAKPDDVLLYELYSDRPAFDAHLESEHFRHFDLASSDMVEDKTVETWAEVSQ